MAIDPSIAMGVRPVQTPNMLAEAGQAAQLQTSMMQNAAISQEMEGQNALRKWQMSGGDLNAPDAPNQMLKMGVPLKAVQSFVKTGLEQRKLGGEVTKQDLDITQRIMGDLANNPSNENITANVQDLLKANRISAPQAQSLLTQALQVPVDKRSALFTKMALDAKTIYQGDITKRGQDISASTTMRGQDISATTARRGQDLQHNPELQGQIETAKAIGKAKGEETVAPLKDIQANVKALKSAGYDPETGKDSISDLIQRSTGSYAGAATDFAGRTVGISTGGAKAIASLKTYESKLTQDLLGGKMGAGISNADRDFIVAGIGQIADPTLPVETRQAAWNSVKERMRVAGMVPAPKGEAGASSNPYSNKTDAEIKKELGL